MNVVVVGGESEWKSSTQFDCYSSINGNSNRSRLARYGHIFNGSH